MAKINTTNYQPVTAWNGTQDLFVVEQPDGTKVATPEQVKQYVEAGDFEATGEIIDGHGNILSGVAEQISRLTTLTQIWGGEALDVGNVYNMTRDYTDFKYLLVTASTNYERKNILIPTSKIRANDIYSDILSSGEWVATSNAFRYNSYYGIKFTAANAFQLVTLAYNNVNWILKPTAIYGIG